MSSGVRTRLVILVVAAGLPAQETRSVPPVCVLGEKGMVVSGDGCASAAGVEILKAGGSAVDAAVAVGFALAATLPAAGNLGGGGFMVIHLADGRETAVDYREMASAGASRDMYLGPDGRAVDARSREGHLAVAVPGSVAGLCHVQKTYGRLPLARVLGPAIRLARDGFTVTRHLAESLAGERRLLEAFPESCRIFVREGAGWKEGEQFRQPELAATLDRIAAQGPDGFYRGRTAELIVGEMTRGGGLVTAADLEGYVVKEREPVRGAYRGHEIVSMPPPSSGGVALIQMLNILEAWPLRSLGPRSEAAAHVMTEAMRAAFRDRARFLGDPDFSAVPARGLISPEHAKACRAAIGDKAAPSMPDGGPDPWPFEKEQTTHYSTMDAAGNAVACTTTLNGSYGSGVTVAGAGFLLNNEMDDFAAAPGQPNMYQLIQGEANAVGPRRRPLSSMTPTLVKRDGRVVMVIGSPGGPTIITTVLHVVANVLDHGMDIARAVAEPRFHHQWLPDRVDFEAAAFAAPVAEGLRTRGHILRERGAIGDAHGITFDPKTGILSGGADPRRGGRAAGW